MSPLIPIIGVGAIALITYGFASVLDELDHLRSLDEGMLGEHVELPEEAKATARGIQRGAGCGGQRPAQDTFAHHVGTGL
jgi:hypothetical protein